MTDLNYTYKSEEIGCFDNILSGLRVVNYHSIRLLNTIFCISIETETESEIETEIETITEPETSFDGFIIIEDFKKE